MVNFKFFDGLEKENIPPPTGGVGIYNLPYSIEPLMSNRFIVTFPPEMGISSNLVQSVSIPECVYNSYGIHRWSDMTISLVSSVGNGRNFMTNDFINGNRLIKTFIIEMLTNNGEVSSHWEVIGRVLSINYDDFDYSENGLAEITMIISVDYVNII